MTGAFNKIIPLLLAEPSGFRARPDQVFIATQTSELVFALMRTKLVVKLLTAYQPKTSLPQY